MKTNKFFQLMTLAICALAFAFVTGCEGPEGPIGPAGTKGDTGATGAAGAQGDDGQQGVAGNSSCLVCHTQVGMDVINASYKISQHAIASTVARGSGSCARCHSSEGFTYYLAGVESPTVSYPTAIRCSTCHSNHSSLEDDISAPMVTEAAVTAITDGTSIIDFEGVSNLCANCHQSRRNADYYDKEIVAKTYDRKFTGDDIATYSTAAIGPAGTSVLDGDTLRVTFDVPVENVYISSPYAGPHYGAQSNTIVGIGGFGASSINDDHKGAGCVTCHMGITGDTEGGHSWWPNVENCIECHEGLTDFDNNGVQTEVETRMAAIAAKLESIHAVHIDAGEVHPMYASIPRAEFEAFWNYMIVMEDRSMGVHNPGYIKTLLTVAETKLGM